MKKQTLALIAALLMTATPAFAEMECHDNMDPSDANYAACMAADAENATDATDEGAMSDDHMMGDHGTMGEDHGQDDMDDAAPADATTH